MVGGRREKGSDGAKTREVSLFSPQRELRRTYVKYDESTAFHQRRLGNTEGGGGGDPLAR